MKEFRIVIEANSFGIFNTGVPRCEKEWTTDEKQIDDYLEFMKKDSPMTYDRARKEIREV